MYEAKVVIKATGATETIAIEHLSDKIEEMQSNYVEESQFFSVKEIKD